MRIENRIKALEDPENDPQKRAVNRDPWEMTPGQQKKAIAELFGLDISTLPEEEARRVEKSRARFLKLLARDLPGVPGPIEQQIEELRRDYIEFQSTRN